MDCTLKEMTALFTEYLQNVLVGTQRLKLHRKSILTDQTCRMKGKDEKFLQNSWPQI
jgi:hypothetical protein